MLSPLSAQQLSSAQIAKNVSQTVAIYYREPRNNSVLLLKITSFVASEYVFDAKPACPFYKMCVYGKTFITCNYRDTWKNNVSYGTL